MANTWNIRDLAAALFAVLLLFVVAVPASAQIIENIARAEWRTGEEAHSAQSNLVSFEILALPVSIETFRPSAASGVSTPIPPSVCNGTELPAIGIPGTQGPVASVERTTSLQVGENLVFRVVAAAANLDQDAVDSIHVLLTSTSGEREEVEIFETAANSGVFVGAIPTAAVPPQPVVEDCRLSVADGDTIYIEYPRDNGEDPIATAAVSVLADPFGLVFDSEDGRPVSGATVTLIDVATGQPATVFADDGVTLWPSTVVSGQPITDGAGNVYPMKPGEYRFPLAPLGNYKLVVTPPSPYSAPSAATSAQLQMLARPNGAPFTISDASFGGSFTLADPAPVRVDIPVDRPGIAVSLSKTVSRPRALPGDVVIYTVRLANVDTLGAKRDVVLTDVPSEWLRLRRDTVRVDGELTPDLIEVSEDGRELTLRFDEIAVGGSHVVTYAMAVRADAPAGQALNRAQTIDSRGRTTVTSAVLTIDRETIGSRMTLIGRVTEGSCLLEEDRRGIPATPDRSTPASCAVKAVAWWWPTSMQSCPLAGNRRLQASTKSRAAMPRLQGPKPTG